MKDRKDVIPLSPDFPFNLFYAGGADRESGLHFHDCLELDLVLEGRGTYRIESAEVPLVPGDIYVINNLEHHMSYGDGCLRLLVIVFDPALVAGLEPYDGEYLQPFFQRGMRFGNRITPRDEAYREVHDLMRKLEVEWNRRETGYRLIVKAVLLQILAILFRHGARQAVTAPEQQQFRKSYESIRAAVRHLHEHLVEPVRLESLASMVSMNRSYFSTLFHRVTGSSVTDYVIQLRLQQACIRLATTTDPVTRIAMETGWPNLSWFNRCFRKAYGMTPRQYRLQGTGNPVV